MATIEVKCPKCRNTQVVKYGINKQKKQRYLCKNQECEKETFILEYENLGILETTKEQIIEMAINGSGIRDTARVLKISTTTLLNELKKKGSPEILLNNRRT
ncbi:MAG: IS1 family transposase [Acidobacteria bacterium]|nr:IS1 family transposase [Acidobacteriota bacterium]